MFSVSFKVNDVNFNNKIIMINFGKIISVFLITIIPIVWQGDLYGQDFVVDFQLSNDSEFADNIDTTLSPLDNHCDFLITVSGIDTIEVKEVFFDLKLKTSKNLIRSWSVSSSEIISGQSQSPDDALRYGPLLKGKEYELIYHYRNKFGELSQRYVVTQN